MKKVIRTAVALLTLSVAAQTPAATRASADLRQTLTFSDKSETRSIKFEVGASDRRTRLRVKTVLQKGEAKWTVRDPTGKVRMTAEVNARGNLETGTGELPAIAGVWVLELELGGASGSYDIVWTAN